MAKFIIHGGKKLNGEVEISGAKNAALKMLAATILTREICVLDNVPRIDDVEVMVKILESIGAKTRWLTQHKIEINPSKINSYEPDPVLVCKMRASIVLAGPLLARFGKAKLAQPGGCVIGVRPVYVHWHAFQKLGVKVQETNKFAYLEMPKKITQNKVVMDEASVTGTENVLMLTAGLPQETEIRVSACEPEIVDLIKMLAKMGAKITGVGSNFMKVSGKKKLCGVVHKVLPDRIETGTFIVAGIITDGKITIKNIIPNHMDMVFNKLDACGVNYKIINQKGEYADIKILPPHNLKPTKIHTQPYPMFPTDLQAPYSVLLTQCPRISKVFESMYEDRLKYLTELSKMGAEVKLLDCHTAEISGPTKLHSAKITSFDLRAGATLLLAGLIANGTTEIDKIELIDRGYEKIDEKLKLLGADIKRIK